MIKHQSKLSLNCFTFIYSQFVIKYYCIKKHNTMLQTYLVNRDELSLITIVVVHTII